ncbi:MAG TPA: metallophosphoesterase [Thermoclostridium sp.]|nr:metallophosphoesterase [Thermoclostridium sp.]
MRKIRPRMNEAEYKAYLEFKKPKNNVLVIGDLHAPFIKEGYLEFCQEMYVKYQCTEIVLIGDLIDMHYSSFHESDPDGYSAGEELKRAKIQIAEFYKAFPKAKVCIGNHDLIPNRKAFTGGLSKYWVKDISEVLETPNWEYSEDFIINNVLYTHGVGRKAKQRSMQEFMSVVQGHYHSESYVETFVSEERLVFAMQIGSGVDRKAYAMAYGKHFKKPQINVGIVLDNGRYGIIEPMKM